MTRYYERNRKLATRNTKPSMTDQSQARETDINVIVKRFLPGQQMPTGKQPIYGADFTQIPQDLASMFAMASQIDALRAKLPKELRNKTNEELIALTPEALSAILTPAPKPAPTPAPTPQPTPAPTPATKEPK